MKSTTMADDKPLKQFAEDMKMELEEVVDVLFESTSKKLTEAVKELSADEEIEGRQEKEKEIKGLIELVHSFLSKISRKYLRRTHSAFAAAHMFDYHSSRGVIKAGDIVLKIKEQRGKLDAEDAHLIDVNDWKVFRNEDRFKLARIYNLFLSTGNYVRIPDVRGKEKQTLVQAQDYIAGSTPGEIIQLLPDVLTKEQESAVIATLIDKPLDDIAYWHTKNFRTHHKDGKEMPLNIDEIRKIRVSRLEKAIQIACEIGGVEFTKEELDYVQKNWKMLYSLISADSSRYLRGRNPTPFNFVLKHPLGELTKENIEKLFEFMKPENLWNIDTEASSGYKHRAEDFADFTESLEFSQIRTSLDPPINGRNSARALYEHKVKAVSYDIPFEEDESMIFFRTMRLPAYNITTYIKNLIENKEDHPEFREMFERYVSEIKHCIGRAGEHLRNIIIQKTNANDHDSARALKPLEGIVRKYAGISAENIIKYYKRRR